VRVVVFDVNSFKFGNNSKIEKEEKSGVIRFFAAGDKSLHSVSDVSVTCPIGEINPPLSNCVLGDDCGLKS
jgi:hypothetical protein